jgi:hypothetical protein
MIHVLIPLAPTHRICNKVQAGLDLQMEVHQVFTWCDPATGLTPRAHEMLNRNSLKVYISEPYTVMMDSDVVLIDPRTFYRMSCELEWNTDIDAVAVDTKGINQKLETERGHVIIACVMYRSEVLRKLHFRSEDGRCCCYAVNRDINIQYHPTLTAKEIH